MSNILLHSRHTKIDKTVDELRELLASVRDTNRRLTLLEREYEIIERQRKFNEERQKTMEANINHMSEAVNKLCTCSVAAIEGRKQARNVAPLAPVKRGASKPRPEK